MHRTIDLAEEILAAPFLAQISTREMTLGVMAALGILGLVILGVLYARKKRLEGGGKRAVPGLPGQGGRA